VSQIVGCTKVTSEESDISADRAFQNDLTVGRAEFAEDLQLGGPGDGCNRTLGFASGRVAFDCGFQDQEIVNAVGVAITVPEHSSEPLRPGQLLQ
jgi:hypothetical protein